MKTVKLFVLLLAFALLCTLAAAFTDDEDIGEGYSEAVAAMAERGVLEGFEDGSFRPEESLTREQGAKIIAYLCLEGECDVMPVSDKSRAVCLRRGGTCLVPACDADLHLVPKDKTAKILEVYIDNKHFN